MAEPCSQYAQLGLLPAGFHLAFDTDSIGNSSRRGLVTHRQLRHDCDHWRRPLVTTVLSDQLGDARALYGADQHARLPDVDRRCDGLSVRKDGNSGVSADNRSGDLALLRPGSDLYIPGLRDVRLYAHVHAVHRRWLSIGENSVQLVQARINDVTVKGSRTRERMRELNAFETVHSNHRCQILSAFTH